MTTLVTGANGFIGAALCERLRKEGVMVREGVRAFNPQAYGAQTVAVGNISSETDWGSALKGVRHVVHLAARVHVMNDGSADPLTEFRRKCPSCCQLSTSSGEGWREAFCVPELYQGEW